MTTSVIKQKVRDVFKKRNENNASHIMEIIKMVVLGTL
jgi:hypothetical protein